MRRARTMIGFWMATGLALAACDNTPVCVPGASDPCDCATGARGTQVCAADGLRHEACTCPEVDGEVDAGVAEDALACDADPPEGRVSGP